MVVEGNHEIERDAAGQMFLAYTSRYRVPHLESGSASPLYYSFDLAGEPVQATTPTVGVLSETCMHPVSYAFS